MSWPSQWDISLHRLHELKASDESQALGVAIATLSIAAHSVHLRPFSS